MAFLQGQSGGDKPFVILGTGADGGNNSSSRSVVIDLTAIKQIKQIFYGYSLGTSASTTVKIQGSNDNSTYTDLAEYTGTGDVIFAKVFTGDVSYRYIKLYWSATGNVGFYAVSGCVIGIA